MFIFAYNVYCVLLDAVTKKWTFKLEEYEAFSKLFSDFIY